MISLYSWIFAAPAVYTIDTYGRRTLLLWGFPLMSLFLLITGLAFLIPKENTAHIAVVALGIYLHCMAYSPTEGESQPPRDSAAFSRQY